MLFEDFNNKYFYGKLPRYRVIVVDCVPDRVHCSHGKHYKKQRLIKLRRCDEKMMVETLLHEMVHAATGDGHGKRFRDKMEELRGKGATTEEEVLPKPRLSKQVVRDYLEDILEKVPDVTLTQFAQYLVREYGYSTSAQALFKSYPWVQKAYRETKRDWKDMRQSREELRQKWQRSKGQHL